MQVRDQGVNRAVELRHHRPQAAEDVVVVVPLAVAHRARVVVARRQRHHRHARLGQPPRLQELDALAVLLADPVRLPADVEGVAGLVARDHFEGLRREGVLPGEAAAGVVQVAPQRVERLQQLPAVRQALRRHVAGQAEVGGLGAGHVRLVGLAQEAGLADVVGVAEVDVGRDRRPHAGVAAQLADHRADRRAVAAQEAGVQLRRRVALLLEAHVADDRQFVGDLRLQGHQLADVQAGDVGVDRLELAADFDGGVRLHVVEVDVAGAAVEVDHDDGLARRAGGGAVGPEPQQVGQRQSADAEGADLEELPPRQAVAQAVFRSEERQHEKTPLLSPRSRQG